MLSFLIHNPKGVYGYTKKARMRAIVYCLFCFGISAALFISGYITTGSKANLLTVVAVLGCLPGSKSLVNIILLYVKARPCKTEIYEQINNNLAGKDVFFELCLTAYDNVYAIDCAVVCDKSILAYSSFDKTDDKKCEAHILKYLEQNSFKGYNVKLFKDINKFINRVNQVSEDNLNYDINVVQLLKELSL